MGKSMSLVLAAAVLVAGAACSRRGSESQPAAAGETDAMGHAHQRVSLRGCVQAAPGFNHYVLHRVTFVTDQASREMLAAQKTMIPPGSWVRLKADKTDLKDYLGQQVTVIPGQPPSLLAPPPAQSRGARFVCVHLRGHRNSRLRSASGNQSADRGVTSFL